MSTQRRRRRSAREDEPLIMDDVLEPSGDAGEGYDGAQADLDESRAPVYQDMYLGYDEYADDDAGEQYEESNGRFKVAMSIFNVISTLVGILLILLLVALLFSLFNWLETDIRHSFVLLQSNLQ